ncbi:hypothetical protein FRB91_002600 [Serendipita sp. 411]|nr:hypothetical protein FRB91_002600 [Serendipita sp. 411]
MKSNFTCGSESPLIGYTGSWHAEMYNSSSSILRGPAVRMVASTTGDAATFNFTGTGIWIFPASSTPHASYDVYLDGTLHPFEASDHSDTDTPLFYQNGLLSIPHVVSIHHTGSNGTAIDLSAIVWEERDMGNNATSSVISGEEDDSPNIAWHPLDRWSSERQTVLQDSGISNVTISVHTSNASDASMQYNFSANAISIFGNIGTNQGPYSVSLQYASGEDVSDQDSKLNEFYQAREVQSFNASFPYNRTKVLLYHASNINASKITTLTMKNIPDKQGDSLTIDYTVLLTYTHNDSTKPTRSIPVGQIVGSILGALLLLGLAFLAFYFLRQRRQGKLIRQQKTRGFRDLLARKGVITSPEQGAKDVIH